MTTPSKLKLCAGCDNNFYNGNNPLGVKRCWHLTSARVVKRWKIHWWTAPTVPKALQEVKTLSCHTESGRFGFYEKLPECAVEPRRLS